MARLIYVDDDPQGAEVLGAALGALGVVVARVTPTTGDLREAIDRFAPDGVLVDLHLGAGAPDGISLCLAARSHDPSLMVGCCSTGAAEAEARRAWASAIDVFVSKEFVVEHPEVLCGLLGATHPVCYTVRPFDEETLGLSTLKRTLVEWAAEGTGVAEMADRLGLPDEVVESHLLRARHQLGVDRLDALLGETNDGRPTIVWVEPVVDGALTIARRVEHIGWRVRWARTAREAVGAVGVQSLGVLVAAGALGATELTFVANAVTVPVAVLGAPDTGLPEGVDAISDASDVRRIAQVFSGVRPRMLTLGDQDCAALQEAERLVRAGADGFQRQALGLLEGVEAHGREIVDALRDDPNQRGAFEAAHRDLAGSLLLATSLLTRPVGAEERATVLVLIERARSWARREPP